MDGIDLYRLVRKTGPLEFLESCDYVRQAALGLQHAFEKGLTHRDIKPHNLMVTPSPLEPAAESTPSRAPVVKILDMGLARLEVADKGLEEGLTCAEAFLGTPDYAAPEQAEDSRQVDVRADLYSLGATWFFLLRRVPFPGTSIMQAEAATRETDPGRADHRPDVPPSSSPCSPADGQDGLRFQTPAELAETIANYVRDVLDAGLDARAAAGPPIVRAHGGHRRPAERRRPAAVDRRGHQACAGGTLGGWARSAGCPATSARCAGSHDGTGKWGASARVCSPEMAVQLWDLGAGKTPAAPGSRRAWSVSRSPTAAGWPREPATGRSPLDARPAGHAATRALATRGTITGVAFARGSVLVGRARWNAAARWGASGRGAGGVLLRGGPDPCGPSRVQDHRLHCGGG